MISKWISLFLKPSLVQHFYRPKGHAFAGGVQIMEPAATNIVTTDSIRRFGGELSADAMDVGPHFLGYLKQYP